MMARYCWVKWSLCVVCILQTTWASTEDVHVEEGGYVLANSSGIHGNDVTYRSSYSLSGGSKSWIDMDAELFTGRLTKYHAYVHNVSTEEAYTSLRLQIWRPLQEPDFLFKLVWEKEVNVRLDYSAGALYTYEVNGDDSFDLHNTDRIGWQNEGTEGAISNDFLTGHHTYFQQITGDPPAVGEDYTFDNVAMPYIYSVAVEVVPVEPLSLPTDAPTVSSITNSSAVVKWKKINNVLDGNSGYYQYAIEYMQASGSWQEWPTRQGHDASSDEHQEGTLTGLTSSSSYQIRVVSFTVLGGETIKTGTTGVAEFKTTSTSGSGTCNTGHSVFSMLMLTILVARALWT